jgi:hypothetical protein
VSVSRETWELSLRDWVVLGTGLDDDKVIFSDQPVGAVKPSPPFATVLVLVDMPGGDVEVYTSDEVSGDGVRQDLVSPRNGTVSVQVFGENHRRTMRTLEKSLADWNVHLFFEAAEIVVTRAGSSGIIDQQEFLAAGFEQRSSQDFVWRRVDRSSVEVVPIEELEATRV